MSLDYKKVLSLPIIIIFVLLTITITVNADSDIFSKVDEYNNLRMGNEYIVIVVNQNDNSKGRFAIETTGGAPFKEGDDYKPLVYGRPNPWTSYTTVKVDGTNYVFGGKTERRAGKNAEYGELLTSPEVKNNQILSIYKMNGIIVEQIFSIVKSSTTGLYDTVQVKYRLTNKSSKVKNTGLRIMLDTMLGKNDGAPMRMGTEAITTDKLFFQNELSNFWQAFDSISSPKVTSQGTFKGQGVTAPDKVYFSDWGSLADGSWDFDFNSGEEFIRKGGYETDSAVAMYWQEEKLAVGESKTYITNYGLGGITIVPGLISLGVTSPAEFVLDKPNKTFPIIAYVENTSEIKAKNVSINLSIPEGFEVANKNKNLGDLEPGDISQVNWQVKPIASDIYQKRTNVGFNIIVEADNTDSNSVERTIKLVGPPGLRTSTEVSDELIVDLGKIKPNPFTITAHIENSGDSILYDTYSELVLPPGITLVPYEKSKKYLSFIKPGEKIDVNWEVRFLNVEGGFKYAVITEGLHGYTKTAKEDINLAGLKPTLYFSTDEDIKKGNLITVDIKAENLSIYDISKIDLRATYDKDYLKPVMVYPGNIFVKDAKVINWNSPNLKDDGLIKIKNILPADYDGDTIASIQFRIKKGKNLPLSWHQIFLVNEDGNQIKAEKIEGVLNDEKNN